MSARPAGQSLFTLALMKMASAIVCLLYVSAAEAQTVSISTVYWSDGDSGRVDGRPFRLANVDAPETGGVGAAIGAAECESERALGYEAKAFIVELTKHGNVSIVREYGIDQFDRYVMDLAVDGKSVATLGLEAGIYRRWLFDGRKELEPKPIWCK